ncbi:MAG TPA: NAD(P)/FAD-dependent oxidoreductase [Gammaproteobacteria bacterium]|nr:NAD(P)/FAD-dependent oxidoreductase [Gammaproteobacteria bacterium]
MSRRPRIAIVGGGPAGSLLAILLARRKLAPLVIERSESFSAAVQGGRSINLALAARGIEALRSAGIDRDVGELMIPMRGRMLHDARGTQRFLRYGQRRHEEIYSVSRAALTALLQRLATDRYGVEYRFGHRCVDVDLKTGAPIVESADGRRALDADVVLACDGAGSEVRRALVEGGAIEATEELLDHGYKELTIPPGAHPGSQIGDFALDPKALHIWPRGGFMLIALPNPDKSFTATLFLPHTGASSFASATAGTAGDFFAREFPDALALMPDLDAEYTSHPTGILGTVYCKPWSFGGRLLLVGDAAHAIVPFHGQGMNAAFEDCIVLDGLIGEHTKASSCDWPTVFERFEESRAPNTRAIAEMAIENYREMRDEVRDAKFQLRAQLSFELERRFPGKFIPRYSMVMFHPEIPYAEAQRRGAVQLRILRELTAQVDALRGVDFARAAELIATDL